jgi:tripartite ATP-independent transporter DctM subunit
MFVIGFSGAWFALGHAVVNDFANQAWLVLTNFALTSIPLFILLGEIMFRSGITEKLYHSLSLWLSRLPGGLLHTNIGACALMAATSGSSVATAASLGVVALPTMLAKGYNERMLLGSICAGGTLGILIPPSIAMIIYGSISNTSIGKLFIAGIIPGILLAFLFSVMIGLIAIIKPSWVGGTVESKTSFRDKLRTTPAFLPVVVIVFAVMGSIYLGWATPTEAAALGVLATLIMAIIKKKVSIKSLHDSFVGMVKSTSMILLIMVAAFYLNYVISILGLPQLLTEWFMSFNFSPKVVVFMVMLLYLVLGMFIETTAMVITTVPMVLPIVTAAGYDDIWFGIFLVVLCEASLVTPPVGMNLYVVQGIRTRKGPMKDIIVGMVPFLAMMIVLMCILIYYPPLATWLPKYMMGH